MILGANDLLCGIGTVVSFGTDACFGGTRARICTTFQQGGSNDRTSGASAAGAKSVADRRVTPLKFEKIFYRVSQRKGYTFDSMNETPDIARKIGSIAKRIHRLPKL